MLLYSISRFLESTYRDDRWVQVSFVLSLILNVLTWVVLWVKIQPLSYLSVDGWISLHYTIYFGIDKIGPWYFVLAMPILGSLVILVNNLISYTFYLKEKIISYFLIGSQLFVQIILLIAAVLIILLNT